MALATVVSTSYGYRITGGVDATLVTTNKVNVKLFSFTPAVAADTCIITDGTPARNAIATIKGDAVAGIHTEVWFDCSRIDGLAVTLQNVADVLLVLVA